MNILISGCGIAGISATLFLQNGTHDITLVDRSNPHDHMGYGLSIKGFGIEVLKQLDLYDELLDHELHIENYTVYDSQAKFIRRFSKDLLDEITDKTVPVSRPDLHRLLYSRLSSSVRIVANTTPTLVSNEHDRVKVHFSDNSSEIFDVAIIAEGLRSTTRRLLWGQDGENNIDLGYAAGIISVNHGFGKGEAKTFKGVGRSISFFPVAENKIALQASFRKKTSEKFNPTINLVNEFSGFSQQVLSLLNQIDEKGELFFDQVGMIKLNSLVKGWVILLGDAGYCPSFLSGMGASLSMLGSKLLSYQINNNARSNIHEALAEYERIMVTLSTHFHNNALKNLKREVPAGSRSEKIGKLIMRNIPLSLVKRSVKRQLARENHLVQQILGLPL